MTVISDFALVSIKSFCYCFFSDHAQWEWEPVGLIAIWDMFNLGFLVPLMQLINVDFKKNKAEGISYSSPHCVMNMQPFLCLVFHTHGFRIYLIISLIISFVLLCVCIWMSLSVLEAQTVSVKMISFFFSIFLTHQFYPFFPVT